MLFLFFFNDTATTEIYTLSLHDALPISPPDHAVDEVRPIERSDQHQRVAQLQLVDDVALHAFGGGRGEGVERDSGKILAQPAELPILGAEVAPPLTDAIGFVDGEQLQLPLLD